MILIINVYLVLIIICTVLMILLAQKLMNDGECVSITKFSEYFLYSIRETQKFSEDNMNILIKNFNYTRKLFNIEIDSKTWNTTDFFLQTCIVAISLLSFYIDEASIYYNDEKIWNILRFVQRLMMQRTKNTDDKIFFNNHLYEVFTAFTYNMYIWSPEYDKQCLLNGLTNFLTKYQFKIYSDLLNEEDKMLETFENYIISYKLCKIFNEQINLNNY